jgi:hypothetical protein
MKLRDLIKCNGPNDGTRSLMESILVPEVGQALSDWLSAFRKDSWVLIGGLALSYYGKPRTTTDLDILLLSTTDIPRRLEGFKRTRSQAFQHSKTHVEVEAWSPASVNMPQDVAQKIFDTSVVRDGVRIASREGLIASKLSRFKLQDQADMATLLELGDMDLKGWPLPIEWRTRFEDLKSRM